MAAGTGDAAGDCFAGIEEFIGSAFNDTLIGDSAANTLHGGDGNDSITAGAGNDTVLGGAGNVVRNLDPSMGSEDFSFMLQAKPGAFARLGQGGAEGGCFLHNSIYDFNDDVIPIGTSYWVRLIEKSMGA